MEWFYPITVLPWPTGVPDGWGRGRDVSQETWITTDVTHERTPVIKKNKILSLFDYDEMEEENEEDSEPFLCQKQDKSESVETNEESRRLFSQGHVRKI